MKSQIWSPDEIVQWGGFSDFVKNSETVPTEDISPSSAVESTESFRVNPEYVAALLEDPEVKKDIEQRVDRAVSERLVKILSQYSSELSMGEPVEVSESSEQLERRLSATEQTLAQNWRKKIEGLEQKQSELVSTWNSILEEWGRKREEILRAHEQLWCSALIHLLKRFQITDSTSHIKKIESWAQNTLSEFLNGDQVMVFLSPQDLEKVTAENAAKTESQKWVFTCDPKLACGEVRVEAGNAGALFSSEQNLEMLKTLIESAV